MTKAELLASIETDLGANYQSSDSTLLSDLLDEVINDALLISNRNYLAQTDLEGQISILASHIRKCVKSIYLARGSEEVASQSQQGLASTYENAIHTMTYDIIRSNKRILM